MAPNRVLELYSGIGGMHYALKESGIPFGVRTAVDINSTANKVYSRNFPSTAVLECSIETLSVDWLDSLNIDMILMSPPCQPFTRIGKKKDCEDMRTKSFLHVLDQLPRLKNFPSYILIENVKGFESSYARRKLVTTIQKCNYLFQEFLLTPLQFGIPNSRCRYYLLAKQQRLGGFSFLMQISLLEELPDCTNQWLIHKVEEEEEKKAQHLAFNSFPNRNLHTPGELAAFIKASEEHGQILHQGEDEGCRTFQGCQNLENFLEKQPGSYFQDYLLPDRLLRMFVIMDIVHPYLRKSVCFTKRYGHYTEGSGSVVQMSTEGEVVRLASSLRKKAIELKDRDGWGAGEMDIIRRLQLRFFTPREIANLLCFPLEFGFPDEITLKQKYRLLGNSLNVHVVAVLLKLLTSGDL